MTAVYLFALLVGLGCWLPAPTAERRYWPGFLFLQSWLLLIVLLYLGVVVLGVALSHMWPILAAGAAGGILWRLWQQRSARSAIVPTLLHPIWVLMGLTGAVIYLNGGVGYLPMPGDETASWLKLARQIFLVDAYWSDTVEYHLGSYTNGWPLLIAFANGLYISYEDGNGAVVAFIMQLGLMGAIFDTVRHIIRNNIPATSSGPAVGPFAVSIAAWVFILTLLAVEASWVLVPTFQLIDEPLIFAFLGCFLTPLLAICGGCSRPVCAGHAGLALAATYLLKLAAIAFLPAALILLAGIVFCDAADRHLGQPREWPRSAWLGFGGLTIAFFLPFVIAHLSWGHYLVGTNCNASPIELLTGGTGPAAQQKLAVARAFLIDAAAFVAVYKVPLTIFAGIALSAGLLNRRTLWLTLAFCAFAVIYTAAAYLGYISCFDVIELGGFEALPRYLRTPLRIAHVLGPIILLIVLLEFDGVRRISIGLLRNRVNLVVLFGVIIALVGWQARSVDRSLDDMRTRDYQSDEIRTMILKVRQESMSLRRIVDRRSLRGPRVSIIVQGGYGAEYDLAMYSGLKSHSDGGSNFTYHMVPPATWGTQKLNLLTFVTDQNSLANHWRAVDIIWPYRTDDWTREILAHLVTDRACARTPELYFLIKNSGGTFECVEKTP